MLSRSLAKSIGRGRDEVYVAAVPLRATKGPAQLLMSTAYSLNFWDFQHFMVIINPSSSPHSKALVYDFQPQDPENIAVAVAALSGRKIPGVVLIRKLKKLPKRKCWFVGYSENDAVDAANRFNEGWDMDLRINHHDCRNYANGLSKSASLPSQGRGKAAYTPPSQIPLVGLQWVCSLSKNFLFYVLFFANGLLQRTSGVSHRKESSAAAPTKQQHGKR